LFIEARETRLEETLAPFGDDLARRIEACGDDVVGQPLGRIQDNLGADNVTIR
jgi:hypothetical protein